MTGKLAGKVAIITGGGQGIGQGIARRFVAEGARVLITGRNADKLEATVAALRAAGGEAEWIVGTAGLRADAEAAAARAIACFGAIDILVNNAQTSRPGTPFEAHDDALFELTVSSGLYGTFQHMQAVLPHMKARGGSIINFGSREG
ncbi:MAG TPA: SDR family NAD(P)-dependent oxidoreductase, partial [Novosphingobium sp.]|nr:SDR family NAD(P)-dependent oxidoreductase [Novosphingobium sp.]